MKNILSVICICSLFVSEAQETSYKFDFGTGKAAKGYTAVSPETMYNHKIGYGFSHQSQPIAIDRGGDPLKGNFITSTSPIYFSVKLPEGNYRIDILLGDKKETSSTIVRAECRRLMLDQIITKKGEIVSKTFFVHLRDSMIRNNEAQRISLVKLKPRESAFLHWDDMLTLEFNDSMPKICALEITPVKNIPTIFLAGNSTVVDQANEPWAAWGQMFPSKLFSEKIVVANYAESGETLKSFKGARRLDKIWSMAQPGDYLFIEFAHNDQKPGGNHLDPFTTYKATLKEWIADTRKHGLTPVLVTSMHRRSFDSTGHVINTLGDYPEAMRQTALEENVLLIDLHAMSKSLYESWGPEKSLKAFVHFPANTFPGQDKKLEDNTHFTTYGANELANCVAMALANSNTALASYVLPVFKTYDPSKPIPFNTFYLPMGRLVESIKPDGN